MKHLIKLAFLLLALLLPATATAHNFEVDGIYYKILNDNEVAVTYRGTNPDYSNLYSGSVAIPSSVTYNGATYSVTSIGVGAFNGCSGLTSVTIPNSVTFIGDHAFHGTAWYDNQPDGLVYAGLVAYKYKGAMPEKTSIILREGTKGIASDAFVGWSTLTSIIIPNSVTTIGYHAFDGCSSLTSISIPNSVTDICDGVFCGCNSLDTVYSYITDLSSISMGSNVFYRYPANYDERTLYIPSGTSLAYQTDTKWSDYFGQIVEMNDDIISFADANVKAICVQNWDTNGDGELSIIEAAAVTDLGTVFEGNSSITSFNELQFFTGLISIGDCAFFGCNGLTSVTIPNTVTTIGDSAFQDCNSLTSVIIGNSVSSIGDYAFYYCTSLTSIEIPNSVSTIGTDAFYGTPWYNNQPDGLVYAGLVAYIYKGTMPEGTSIILREGTKSIGSNAFDGCSGLTSVSIPNSVTSIGFGAFLCCSGLTSIEIPNSVTTIDGYTFAGCYGLTSIEIPNSVTSIGNNVFEACGGLTSVTIPNSVTSIGSYAFFYCTGLTSIDIPNSVTSIGSYAFSYCNGLNEVYSYITDLSSISMGGLVFDRYSENYDDRTLYVPAGTLAAYQADTRWSDYFGSIVEMGNYFTIPDTTVMHGDTIVVPVKMFNEADVISFQTDIFLPEGLELLQEDGEYIIDPSERMTRTHSIMSNQLPDGSIRVLCYSSNYKPFTGNSGDDLFYLALKVADDAEGDYTIQLKNTLLTNADFVDMPAPDVAATVNVKAYILGDANNSRLVTVGDVVATAQYVLEQNPQPFIFEAADVNFDGNITVADVSRIAWMVLNPGAKAPRRAPAVLNSGDRMSGEGISLMPGETRRVSIALDNALDYSAFQLDLSLPEGLTASNFQLTDRAGSHAFDVNTLGGGKFRALCYSPALTAISGHEGALVTFDVTANAAITGAITVDGIELVTTACESVRLDGFAIDVNSTSGVNEQVAGKTVACVDYYNLAGQQIDRPEAGVTLVVTTYTDGTRATAKIVR